MRRPGSALGVVAATALACSGTGGGATRPEEDGALAVTVTPGDGAEPPLPVNAVWVHVQGTTSLGATFDLWERAQAAGGKHELLVPRIPIGTYAAEARAFASAEAQPGDDADCASRFVAVQVVRAAEARVLLSLRRAREVRAATELPNAPPAIEGVGVSAQVLDSSDPAAGVSITATVSDPDGASDIVGYGWSASYLPPLEAVLVEQGDGFSPVPPPPDPNVGRYHVPLAARFRPPPEYEGTATMTLAVTDGGGTSSESIDVFVHPGSSSGRLLVGVKVNRAPRILEIVVPSAQLPPRGSTTVTAVASDPDGDALTYEWANDCGGSFVNRTSKTATFQAPAGTATCRLRVEVRDARGGTNEAWVEVAVVAAPSVYAPAFVIAAQTPLTPRDGAPVRFLVRVEDPVTHVAIPESGIAASDGGAGGAFQALGPDPLSRALEYVWTPPDVCSPGVPSSYPFRITFTATAAAPDPRLVASSSYAFDLTLACTGAGGG
jgi:hypothetical protein